MKNLSAYDLDGSLIRLGGDMALFRKLVDFFFEDAPPMLERIRQSIATGNAAHLERAAHSLKGLSSNFGAEPTVQAARQVEEFGRAGDLHGAARLLPELESQVLRLRAALACYRDAPNS